MNGRRMKIGGMSRCDCGRHTWLVLHEREGGTHVWLRIHADLASWFTPDHGGITRLVRGLGDVLQGVGQEPRAVIVSYDAKRRIRLRLRLAGSLGETEVECEPGVALLAAERIGLPILLQLAAPAGDPPARPVEPAPTAIPEVYREALAELGLLEGAPDCSDRLD